MEWVQLFVEWVPWPSTKVEWLLVVLLAGVAIIIYQLRGLREGWLNMQLGLAERLSRIDIALGISLVSDDGTSVLRPTDREWLPPRRNAVASVLPPPQAEAPADPERA